MAEITNQREHEELTDHPMRALAVLLEEAARTQQKLQAAPLATEKLQKVLSGEIMEFSLRSTDLFGQLLFGLFEEVAHLRALIDTDADQYTEALETILVECYRVLRLFTSRAEVPADLVQEAAELAAKIDNVVNTDEGGDDEPTPAEQQ